jgi:plasmid replication initiation protein
MRRKHHSERDQLELFRAVPGDLAPRDAQDLMAYPFFSLAKTKRIAPIDLRACAIAIRVEAVPEQGMATIWDADVLISAASQIDRAYFDLTGGLERWLYRLVRKHGGCQDGGWSFDLVHPPCEVRHHLAAQALCLRRPPDRPAPDIARLSARAHARSERYGATELRTYAC